MTRTVAATVRALSSLALALMALLLAPFALAQGDAIAFEIETFRVDLVREDGEIVERFVPVDEAIPGEEIEYRVTARHTGDVIYRPGTVVVTVPFGDGVAYQEGSATPSSDRVLTEFSADGGATYAEPPVLIDDGEGDRRSAGPDAYTHVRWTFSILFEPEQEEELVYRVTVR